MMCNCYFYVFKKFCDYMVYRVYSLGDFELCICFFDCFISYLNINRNRLMSRVEQWFLEVWLYRIQ